MIPHYNKIHNRFKIKGFHANQSDLSRIAYSFIKEGETYEKEIGLFLLDWLDNNDFIITKTSGTTGKPKEIKIKKQAMVHSALATGDFFKLKPGNTALHCLPCQYIAGKMMLVRAIILGLEITLVNPKGNLFQNDSNCYDFVAMVPLQVENSLEDLHQIKKLIIGGAKPSRKLIEILKSQSTTEVFETYGMTETITHIAAKNIQDDLFKVLPNISISKDERDCLVIEAPRITSEKIVTNDIIEISENNNFKWLGRIDNVINSGGVKLFPEQIEKKLEAVISERFFITSEEDKKLGNKAVLVIESKSEAIENLNFDCLDKYEKPKEIYLVSEFVETETGKVNRRATFKKRRTAH